MKDSVKAAAAALGFLATACASNASAGDCVRTDASLAGRYYLQGVMEVGSELRLAANGAFEYMLAYGALDEYAAGCWSRDGRTVRLVAKSFRANAEDPMKFETLDLDITEGGKLVRRFDPQHVGVYSRWGGR